MNDQSHPSQSCKACHASAYQAWESSRHATALGSLTAENRTDDCIGCHSISLGTPATKAANVQCQSCHLGADAHERAPATIKTSGTVDCRSCHDARHHPGFDHNAAWQVIRHGR